MTLPKFSIFILAAAWCAISCTKQPQDEGTFEFTMNKSSLGCGSSYFWIGVQAEQEVQWTLSLSFGEDTVWAELRDSLGAGNALVACDYKANPSEASRSMTITLTSADARRTTSYSISQSGNLPPGAYPEWMELPEPSDKYELASHYFKKGYYTYRNYSVGWTPENRLSVWVAYPLNNFYTAKSTARTNTWSYDPQINTEEQPCLYWGYHGYSGEQIDRGHQLPSADRLCCESANNQTFYFTNMTPQRDGFNTTVWSALESKVRTYASRSDTLYVVTGAVVGSSPSYAYDNLSRACPIPSHYYKALLVYKKNTSFGHSGWLAAGFWLDHSTSAQSKMSIRELEAKLGFDLFPNLKTQVGESLYDTIEKESPTNSFWN